MYKTCPNECVLLTVKLLIELFKLNKSGLYFQPPMTIISSKNIIVLIINPTGICPELDSDANH